MKRHWYVLGALLAVFWVAPLSAQQTGTVRGTVSDSGTREPLSGVTVTIGDRGALTGSDGRYVLSGVPAGTYTVRARMLGYAPATASATVLGGPGAIVVDFAMRSQAVSLSEMVVVGYGEQSAGNVTGAVTQLSAADFNPGLVPTPQLLIENKVAGVQVVDNNDPGGGLAIRIRGTTSVSASSDPLYVVDGMPLSTGAGAGISAGRDPLNFLNPNDIESITVLKDAASAAIYGTNAANGVVLITTKSRSGSGGPGTRFEYSGSMSSSSVTKIPSLLSATQFDSIVRTYADTSRSNQLGTANTNWFNLIDRSAFSQEHNLTVTSAGERSYFRLSGGYLNQQGIIKASELTRYSLSMNYEQRLLDDHLAVKANVKGSQESDQFTPGGVLGNAAQMGPTQPIYDPAKPTGYYNYPGYNIQAPNNPVEILNLSKSQGTTYRSVGNVQADYTLPFFPALRANLNLGYDVARVTSGNFTPSTVAQEIKSGEFGYENRLDNTQLNTVFEAYLNYASPLNVLPGNIDVTGGYSYAQSNAQYATVELRGLSTDFLGLNGLPASTTTPYTNLDVQDSKLISFFGRLNYNIADRYLASVTVRRDGSSRFGPNNAWGTFPAVSLAWRLSEEPLLKGIGSLSDLKLRASWGRTGNQAFANYQQYATYTLGNTGSSVWMGNGYVTTLRPGAYDPNIKWEQTSSYDVGLDFGFLSQRFSGSIDWYTKKTTDILFQVPVAAGTNLSNQVWTNIGSMRNRGLEFGLTARLLEGGLGGLSWTADFTAANMSNELLEINPFAGSATQIPVGQIAGGTGNYVQTLMPGQPLNTFFVCRQFFDSTTHAPVEGRYYYAGADSTFTGTCDGRGQRPFHDPAPKWMLGHTSNFTYRNFDVSFTLRAWLGNWVYNNTSSNNGFVTQATLRASPYNLSTSVLTTKFQNAQYWSDVYVEDGSFLRMDNITLGYTFRYHGQPMRIYGTVQNAFTVTGYKGVDPTAGLNGIDSNLYPRSRTFTGGLSVRF